MAQERELAHIYVERFRAELAELAVRGFLTSGSAFAPVLFVKGNPNPAERSGAPLLSGVDGDALAAALSRLGYPDDGWAACTSLARGADGSFAPADPADLAWAVEVFDPQTVVALDSPAARALQAAWELPESLVAGSPARVLGRRVLALGGFEAALADPQGQGKRVMWARLKLIAPLASPL